MYHFGLDYSQRKRNKEKSGLSAVHKSCERRMGSGTVDCSLANGYIVKEQKICTVFSLTGRAAESGQNEMYEILYIVRATHGCISLIIVLY